MVRIKPRHRPATTPSAAKDADSGGPTHRGGKSSRRSRREFQEADGPGQNHVTLYGIHAAEAALLNEHRRIERLVLTDNAETRLADAIRRAKARHVFKIEPAQPREIDRILGPEAVHQGVLIEAQPLANVTVEDLVPNDPHAKPALLVVLDQVTDPHNVGAILRSAAVFGAGGLIMTQRNSPALSGALAKAASGGLEHVPVALVPNLAQALAELGELGVWRLGLDGTAPDSIELIGHDRSLAIVLGAEGRGLRQLTRERCDQLVKITTAGMLDSLNVSNAAAVALHCLAQGLRPI